MPIQIKNKCHDCEKEGTLRQLCYTDHYGEFHLLEEYRYYCDGCWRFFILCSD